MPGYYYNTTTFPYGYKILTQMNLSHLKTNDTKFILQLVLTMTLFLGSTVVHSIMHSVPHDTSSHMVTEDTTFESEHVTNAQSLKNLCGLCLSRSEPVARDMRPTVALPLSSTLSYVPHPVYTFWSRGPPKT